MANNLDKKYRSSGYENSKDIKYRQINSFEKDLTSEKEVSKKVEKPKNKEVKYLFEIEYYFNQFRFGVNKDYKIEYKLIEFEARDKKEAKELFEKWDKERKEALKKIYDERAIKEGKKELSFFGSGLISDPEYFIKINDIRKVNKNVN